MIVNRAFWIEGGGKNGESVSMRVTFDDVKEADAFNRDLVALYLEHEKRHVRAYRYENENC